MENTDNRVRKKLRKVADYAFAQKERIKKPGLIGGKMGLCVNLYHLCRYLDDEELLKNTDDFLDEIYQEINLSLPIHFSNGLTGMAWGLLHLMTESFAEGDADSTLFDIDLLLGEVNKYFPAKEYSFQTGFMGQMIYIIDRIKNCDNKDSLSILQLQVSLISLIERLDHVVMYEDALFSNSTETVSYRDIYFVAIILAELQRLEIYKSKVEKIKNIFCEKLAEAKEINSKYERILLCDVFFNSESVFSKIEIFSIVSSLVTDIRGQIWIEDCLDLIMKNKSYYKDLLQKEKDKFIFQIISQPVDYFAPILSDGYCGFYKLLKYI